jgi:hypothetical protein
MGRASTIEIPVHFSADVQKVQWTVATRSALGYPKARTKETSLREGSGSREQAKLNELVTCRQRFDLPKGGSRGKGRERPVGNFLVGCNRALITYGLSSGCNRLVDCG